LNIPSDKLETLEKVIKSNIADSTKKSIIRKLTNGSVCSGCAGIPSLEARCQLEGAVKVERYCESCVRRVYEREQVL
jgi:hypothetical protein